MSATFGFVIEHPGDRDPHTSGRKRLGSRVLAHVRAICYADFVPEAVEKK